MRVEKLRLFNTFFLIVVIAGLLPYGTETDIISMSMNKLKFFFVGRSINRRETRLDVKLTLDSHALQLYNLPFSFLRCFLPIGLQLIYESLRDDYAAQIFWSVTKLPWTNYIIYIIEDFAFYSLSFYIGEAFKTSLETSPHASVISDVVLPNSTKKKKKSASTRTYSRASRKDVLFLRLYNGPLYTVDIYIFRSRVKRWRARRRRSEKKSGSQLSLTYIYSTISSVFATTIQGVITISVRAKKKVSRDRGRKQSAPSPER